MFAKEIRDTLRQTLSVLPFFVIVPALYLLKVNISAESMSLLEYCSIGFASAVYTLGVFLAYNMFQAEDLDGAVEYLLSLPTSRTGLFLAKAIPRVAVLIPLMLLAQMLPSLADPVAEPGSGAGWLSIREHLFLLLTVLCGFIAGVIGRRSWLTIAILSLVMLGSIHADTAGVLSVLGIRDWVDLRAMSEGQGQAYINTMILTGRIGWILTPVMLAAAFLPVYRRWALSSRRAMELAFAKRASLLVVLLLVPVIERMVRP